MFRISCTEVCDVLTNRSRCPLPDLHHVARWSLLTPRSVGAVAVVSVSGNERRQDAARLLRRSDGSPLDIARCLSPHLAVLQIDHEEIDEVLVLDRANCVEIQLHASEAVLGLLESHVGGFVDPPEMRAHGLLCEARSDAQLALAFEQRHLDLKTFLAELASFPPQGRKAELDAAMARSRAAMALARPERLVLCGARNAGKSTLMNRLLFSERVLAGGQPGLTRDPVREVTMLGGYPYMVVDTAGEGGGGSQIDRDAVELGRREQRGALTVLVADGSRTPGAVEGRLCRTAALVVRSKADLPPGRWPQTFGPWLALSCRGPGTATAVREAVGERLRAVRGLAAPGPVGGFAAIDDDELASLAATGDNSIPQ